MEVYKVVEKNTRNCSNWTLFKYWCEVDICNERYGGLSAKQVLAKGKKFREKNIDYFPRYLKGKIIHSPEGSPGILCFKNIGAAEEFKSDYVSLNRRGIIIKVKGIGEATDPGRLVYSCGGDGIFNIKNEGYRDLLPPKGTIAFKSVKVLE